MKSLCYLAILLAYICLSNACNQSILDIVLVIDASGSVGSANFQLAKDALVNLVSKLNVGPNKVHVGVIQYDNTVRPISSLVANEQDKNVLIANIKNIPYSAGATATGDAINFGGQLFKKYGRTLAPRICVVFTDGYSNTGSSVYTAATALKNDKVDIYAIGIGSGINHQELDAIASYPTTTYKKLIQNYASLMSEINTITTTVCNTNAFFEFGQKAVIDAEKNEIRNFQTDLTKLTNLKSSIVELEVTYLKGTSVVNWSLTTPNPTAPGDSYEEPKEKTNTDGTKSISHFIFVPAGTPRLYFSVKALSDGPNQYEISLNKF